MSILEIQQTDLSKLFAKVAAEIGVFLQTLTDNEHIVVALPGGRSVVKLLDALLPALRALPSNTRAKLHFFMVDERVVELSSPDSNYKMLNELFYSKAISEGLIAGSQLHPFDISGRSVEQTINDYGQTLSDFGGVFDLAVLGVGEDAHVAGLFPNHHSITNPAEQFISFKDSPKPPPYRMTASRKLVSQSKMGVALFIGEAKRLSLEAFKNQDVVEKCPAAILKKLPLGIVATDIT